MKTIILPLSTIFMMAIIFTSCISDEVKITTTHYTNEEFQELKQYLDLPETRDEYTVQIADHMMNMGAQAPFIHDAKATLGRVLFYDTKLSKTEETSCASCHKQSLAFSDDKALSDGINGQKTKRNSLPLASVANFSSSYDGGGGPGFNGGIGFFWDERANTISEQSNLTIQDDIEMGMDMNELAAKLSNERYYQILFGKAFESETVTPDRITEAIQEFVNSFVSIDSPFDIGLNQRQGDPFANFSNFSEQENLGKQIYVENCSTCHAANMSTPSFVNMANNGLDVVYEDKGLGARTNNPTQNGVFKVPFLRNIELTYPYMHDGRFETLEEVVEHYSTGIQDHPNLSEFLREPNGEPKRFNFTAEEKAALVAFLKTVTDNNFVAQKRFSDPF